MTGRWGAFSSVPGWTAISGSPIEFGTTSTASMPPMGRITASSTISRHKMASTWTSIPLPDRATICLLTPARGPASPVRPPPWRSCGTVGRCHCPPGNSWQNYDFTVVGTGVQSVSFWELVALAVCNKRTVTGYPIRRLRFCDSASGRRYRFIPLAKNRRLISPDCNA